MGVCYHQTELGQPKAEDCEDYYTRLDGKHGPTRTGDRSSRSQGVSHSPTSAVGASTYVRMSLSTLGRVVAARGGLRRIGAALDTA